jgi:acyl carrier protein
MSKEVSEAVTAALANFIREELLYDCHEPLTEDTDLIQEGVIDSMSLLRLVTFMEEQCKIDVKDEDLVLGNFRSLGAIREFVRRSLSS